MRCPEVRYARTEHDDYLDLHGWDGTFRGILFANADQAEAALAPGRAELAFSAIMNGLLPAGSRLVSRAGVSSAVRALEPEALSAVPDREEI